jgi:transcription elongation factor SPT4
MAGLKLRACINCSFIKSAEEFKQEGCPNCEEELQIAGSTDRVLECTTTAFQGFIVSLKPRESWVAKWQRISKLVPGTYAISVEGELED